MPRGIDDSNREIVDRPYLTKGYPCNSFSEVAGVEELRLYDYTAHLVDVTILAVDTNRHQPVSKLRTIIELGWPLHGYFYDSPGNAQSNDESNYRSEPYADNLQYSLQHHANPHLILQRRTHSAP